MAAKARRNNKLIFQRHGASRPVTQFQRHGASRPVTHFQRHGASRPVTHFQRYGASRPVTHFQRYGASRPVCHNRMARALPLRGSVLISVMVVLLIVGLLISQTLQTLLLVRRGDDARMQLRQARELVELGEIVLQQNPSAQNIDEVRFDAESRDERHPNASDTGSIRFERLNSGEDGPRQVRISVIYRTGSHAEINATQIVAESE